MAIESSIMAADSTVRSQDSNNSSDSKDTKVSKMSDSTRASSSKQESCLESKHSKEALIDTRSAHGTLHHHTRHQMQRERSPSQARDKQEPKDDSSVLMFTSCGQLLLGIVLVVFGVLVLAHGASLSGSGAGLWSGTGAIVAGALGVVATLATDSRGFSSAHLASSLVALALANMAAITALTAVVRDAQRPAPDVTLLTFPNNQEIDVQEGWAGLLASIGLLVASVVELFVAGYTCLTLAPKLCSCLRPSTDDDDDMPTTMVDGKTLKTRNMVHQWVIAQNHVPKNQPIYVVQPVVPMHPMMQPPYGMPPPPPPGKYAGSFLPMQMLPPPGHHHHHMVYPPPPPPSSRPPSQIARGKQQQHPKKRRHSSDQSDGESRQHRRSHHHHQQQAMKAATTAAVVTTAPTTISDEQLARTYTGLDKRISEEFISIAMDPERKSKASSHHGSEINAANK